VLTACHTWLIAVAGIWVVGNQSPWPAVESVVLVLVELVLVDVELVLVDGGSVGTVEPVAARRKK
jgi:hypothetical protein